MLRHLAAFLALAIGLSGVESRVFASEPKLRAAKPAAATPAESARLEAINARLEKLEHEAQDAKAKTPRGSIEPVEPIPDSQFEELAPAMRVEADVRPEILVYSLLPLERCLHCQRQKNDEPKLTGMRFRHVPEAPEWVGVSPTLHFRSSLTSTGWTIQEGWTTAENFAANYLRHNPPPGVGAAGKTIADQIRTFGADGMTFDIRPVKPVRTVMDDGTVVSYSAIKGKLKIENGVPTIFLQEPYPRIDAKKFFMHFGATLYQIQLQDTQPPSIAVGTSLGRYVIEMKPAK